MSKYPSTFVIVNGERVNTECVKFIDIEEGPQGEDIMTFEYEGLTRRSAVYRNR